MNAVLKRFVLTGPGLASLLLMGGCVPPKAFDTSSGHINQPVQTAASATPPPAPVRAAPTLARPQPSAPVPGIGVEAADDHAADSRGADRVGAGRRLARA